MAVETNLVPSPELLGRLSERDMQKVRRIVQLVREILEDRYNNQQVVEISVYGIDYDQLRTEARYALSRVLKANSWSEPDFIPLRNGILIKFQNRHCNDGSDFPGAATYLQVDVSF